ncbi:MAG TPA: phospholipase D-like domain-containing protein [Thermoanaerobaculia bacterium]|nr:phospholipase D-like domain-containing protein [Thermoanaerobaculia bacterium]
MFPIALTVAAAAALLVSFILWSRTRRRHVHVDLPRGDVASLMRSIAALTYGRIVEGNGVRIIQDEAFFEALLDDLAHARHHFHLETFLWADGVISDRVVAALSAAAQHIEVRVLVDQRGAKTTSPEAWAKMRKAGVDFRVYHRARLLELGWYNNRDHRKIAVIDGRIAYTFGHGISDLWGGLRHDGWRDTAARFEGPIVAELQTAFLENWIKVTRRALAGPQYFPELATAGDIPMHVAYAAPPETSTAVHRLYYLAIAAAQREILLQNPYFLPDRHALQLYIEAVQRGVAVKLMLPSSGTSDFPIVQHASHHYYGPLLDAGAVVYEYDLSGLHQKVMIIDREWCTIGSTNFDPRSFRINDEVTVAIYDPAVAEELANAFAKDVQHAHPWTLEHWNARSLGHRLKDRVSVLAKRQL